MADKNFNQGQQSHQDWDKDRDRNRTNQDNDWSSQNVGNSSYGGSQNRETNQNYRDVGYSGDSSRGMSSDDQRMGSKSSYIPDNDDNRSYGNRNYENSQFGTSGYRNSGTDYNSGGYRSENRGGFGNDYGNSDWNRSRGYDNSSGNQYGSDNDRNRRQMYQNSSNDWNSDRDRQDWGRGNVNYGDNDNQRGYGNQGYGSNYGGGYNSGYGSMGSDYGNRNNDYGRSDWNRSRYNRNDRRDSDNNWWEKTKDKVSSWFNEFDDRNDRRTGDYSSYRGKGPSDYRRSDDRIREDVCDRLTDDDRVDASNIRVQIESDAVILSGTVNSREEKRRAEDLVESVSGVRNVENRLRVGGSLSSHEYTGNTDNTGGIGNESGTTNEIIRNTENERESSTHTGRTKNT
jgi:osmotically-inducible protein OsmY